MCGSLYPRKSENIRAWSMLNVKNDTRAEGKRNTRHTKLSVKSKHTLPRNLLLLEAAAYSLILMRAHYLRKMIAHLLYPLLSIFPLSFHSMRHVYIIRIRGKSVMRFELLILRDLRVMVSISILRRKRYIAHRRRMRFQVISTNSIIAYMMIVVYELLHFYRTQSCTKSFIGSEIRRKTNSLICANVKIYVKTRNFTKQHEFQ